MSVFNYNPFINHIGLDISDSKMRYIQLWRHKKKAYEIEAFSETALEPGLIVSGEVSDPTAVAKKLEDIVAHPQFGKLKSAYVTLSVPEKRSFVKVLNIPLVPEAEQRGAVRWSIEQNIPVTMSEIMFDWQLLKRQPGTPKDQLSVMVSVAPKTIISTYIQIVNQAGLIPVNVENESAALTRALVPHDFPADKSLMIVDLGRSRTNIMIFSNRALQFSSTVEVSGNEMTRAVQDRLHLSFGDAEKIKILHGLDKRKGKGQIQKVLEPLMMQLSSKIKEYIAYYNNYMVGSRTIDQVLLTGNVSKLSGAQAFFKKQLGVTVSLADTFTNIQITNSKDQAFNELNIPSYATAVGLALKELV